MRGITRPLVLLVILITGVAGCGSGDKAKGDGPVYVALGDSYTSGPGIEPMVDQRCARSSLNYPSLVAKALHAAKFRDRSCGAATTTELEKPQHFKFVLLNDPQMDAVDKDTTLVTVGIGLNNDLISTGLLLTCLTPQGAQPSSDCTRYLGYPDTAIEAQIDAAAADVEKALETIARKAPRAQVILVGYPRLVPDEGDCPDRLPVPEAQVARMRDAFRYTNDAWRKAAEDAGAEYVDMYTPSEGHDICSSDPWVSDYKGVPGKSYLLHPFAAYEKAAADAIVKLVENG